jgi:ABC-type branched-subunit amino acid transport system substrate-binding protein
MRSQVTAREKGSAIWSNRRTAFACLALLCVLSALSFYGSSAQSWWPAPVRVQSPVTILTQHERRGKAIYHRGMTSTGREIVAVMGEVDVPASTLTCAGCHGARGEGKTEGGVTAGELTWKHLTKPYGHTHPNGRKHGPFDELSFIRSVANGVDPAGNTLLVAMPRYQMMQDEMSDLIAYVKRIEADRDPGLTEQTITVGSVLPAHGPLAETGAAMRDVLLAYFDNVNSHGGIYSRKIDMRVAESGADADATAAGVKEFIAREQVFAFVGGVSAGAEGEIAALVAEREIPFVGPLALLALTGAPFNRQVFYLLPGVTEQARSLVAFTASKPGLTKSRAAVVVSEGTLITAAAVAAEMQAEKSGWGTVERYAYKAGGFDGAQLVRKLRQDNVGVVFFFGQGGDVAAFVKEATAVGWIPHILLLGTLVGRDLIDAIPQTLSNKLFLAFPTVPEDITQGGMSEFRALREKYKFASRHLTSQLLAFAAAKVFVEALKRAGQDLTREKLIVALEGFYDFETGIVPRLTFGPNRRVGSAGAYIVGIDAGKKQFVNVGGWVNANQ